MLLRGESLVIVEARLGLGDDEVFCSLGSVGDSVTVLRRRLGKGILG